MKLLLLIISFFLIGVLSVFAQDKKSYESYNYLRGVEAINQKNKNEALFYFTEEVEDNPKNGYAFYWISVIRCLNEEFGRALTAIESAIKYIPKKDSEFLADAYLNRGAIYAHLEDTTKAIKDYTSAIRLNPSTDLYNYRAELYMQSNKLELAQADFKKMIQLDPGCVQGHMGLGLVSFSQGQWDESIKQFSYTIKLDNTFVSAYSYRAAIYGAEEKWEDATNDLIAALGLGGDAMSTAIIDHMEEAELTLLISKIKILANQSFGESWNATLGALYKRQGQYDLAIPYFKKAIDNMPSASLYAKLAQCENKNGNYEDALKSINNALNLDNSDLYNNVLKSSICYELGDVSMAIAEMDKVLDESPDYSYGFYWRGWLKRMAGALYGAVEDLSRAIELDPTESSYFGSRGDVYLQQGKRELAERDYKTVIAMEDSPEKYDYIHYAYQALGQNNKAIEAMNMILQNSIGDKGVYYDAACLYSRMHNKNQALFYLDYTLGLGYKRFAHLERDPDLDYIRSTTEFNELIEKYKPKQLSSNRLITPTANKEAIASEIPFTLADGVCKVKCEINGLPLHFVFDTGASDVTISMVEATFMLKNEYLSSKDIVGNQRYIDANGDVSVGTVILLKHVKFGGLELENVRASVVRNQKAPLLLGQSVLGRLGKIEIDYNKRVLRITH